MTVKAKASSSKIEKVAQKRRFLSNVERKTEADVAVKIALATCATESIQALNGQALAGLQSLLGHGDKFGQWVTPKDWYPGTSAATLDVDLRARILDVLRSHIGEAPVRKLLGKQSFECLVESAVLSTSRYLMLCRVGSVCIKGRTTRRSLDTSTIAMLAYHYLPKLAAISLTKAVGRNAISPAPILIDGRCFSGIIESDLTTITRAPGMIRTLTNELHRMRMLADWGLWSDTPAAPLDSTKITTVRGEREVPVPPPKREPHLPLPDEYVSEMGQKSYWIIEQLAPCLLKALTGLTRIWQVEPIASGSALSRRCNSFLASFEWVDASGTPIVGLPFQSRSKSNFRGAERPRKARDWPPRTAQDVLALARILQGAHLFVCGLSMGSRRTELASLQRTCLHYAKDGEVYANGRTYKLVSQHDGQTRDWVLPEFAVQAIEQQSRLVTLLDRLPPEPRRGMALPDQSSTHLWGRLGGGNDRTLPMEASAIGKLLRTFAYDLGMEENPSGQPIRTHRLRKTLARLAALAITSAPKVLQDVFGHKSIEMTLYYILADKALAAEIETIASELRVMRAEAVIADMVAVAEPDELAQQFGGYGGVAALTIDKAVRMHRDGAHRRGEDWGTNDVRELAEILTMQGKTWQLVRPGVVCTKSIGQAGPCNKKKGYPEPSRCHTHCEHRLEEAWHREEVDQCISESLELYIKEAACGEDLVAAHWAGQIRAHIGRFPDLHAKWMNDTRVQIIMTESAP